MKKPFFLGLLVALAIVPGFFLAFPQQAQALYWCVFDDLGLAARCVRGAPAPIIPTCPQVPPGHQARDPKIASGALCRGACGADCDEDACLQAPLYTLCVSNAESHRFCTYRVTDCGSHSGCVTHDTCYDACATNPDPIACRRSCDLQCIVSYDVDTCLQWAEGKGPQPNRIKFTDPPAVGALQAGPCP